MPSRICFTVMAGRQPCVEQHLFFDGNNRVGVRMGNTHKRYIPNLHSEYLGILCLTDTRSGGKIQVKTCTSVVSKDNPL